jgi:AsmA protein
MMAPRVKWSALFLFALLALTAGFYRWPISSAWVAQETGVRLSQSLGLELRRPGRAQFNLLPVPTLHMIDVEVRGRNNATILTAPAASARLALLPLLSGRFELAAATLLQPTILLDLDSRPFESGSAISTTIGAKTADRDSTPLGALEIHGGLLHIVSAADDFDTLVEDVEGALDWPRLEDPLNVDLRARWRDEPLTIAARLGEPAALLKGMHSDGRLSVSSSLAQIRLVGDFQSGGQNWFTGAVSADLASVAEIKRILGLPNPSALSDARIALTAKATAGWRMLTLSELRLGLLEQDFEGALAVTRAAGRLLISGTLAANELKLQPLLASAPPVVDATGDWNGAPFDLRPLAAFDLDLRVSASRVVWRGHPLTDAAIELINKDERLTATLVEASAYGGVLKAELSFAPAPGGAAARASGSLANADIGALCADFGWAAYSGQGGGQFAFEAVGDSPAALARALQGKATIQLAPGVVDGLSFEEALRRSEHRPIDVFNDMRVGRTVFKQAAASLTMDNGEDGILNASLSGPGVSVSFTGSMDIVDRKLSARATATQTDEKGVPTSKGRRLEFELKGPWSAPTIKPSAAGG